VGGAGRSGGSRRNGEIEYHYVVVDLVADYVGGEPAAGDDAAEAAWVRVDDLGTLAVSEETVRLVRRLRAERTRG
jgi:8-oxo-dGTP diphosphatase